MRNRLPLHNFEFVLLGFSATQLALRKTFLLATPGGDHRQPSRPEASRILGASPLQALFHITAPLLRAGIVSSWCFIFLEAMRELSAAIMLFSANTKVVATVMFDLNEGDQLGSVSVLGLILLVSSVAVLGLATRFAGGAPLRGQG